MTTDTQNTVFLKAPEIVVTQPVRCEVGASLHRDWVKAYNAAVKLRDDSYQVVFGRGYLPYARHAMTCVACLEVEKSRRAGR